MRFKVYRSGLLRREWRWRLLAGNSRIIATSGEGYRNKADCLSAIERLRELASAASVDIVSRA